MLLTSENAEELDRRIHERLNNDSDATTLSSQIRKITVRAIVIALQEYERMKEDAQNV